jgi:hypothetical protein
MYNGRKFGFAVRTAATEYLCTNNRGAEQGCRTVSMKHILNLTSHGQFLTPDVVYSVRSTGSLHHHDTICRQHE